MLEFLLITSETPNATKLVCTRQPNIKPATVAKPYFLPLTTPCVRTKILSGPGENAKVTVAKTKEIKVVIIKI